MSRRIAGRALLCLVLALPFGPAWAIGPDEVLPDRVLEGRARDLSAELRCLVCQNQSIDESDAPLARDLRLLVRDRLRAGDSDEEIRRFVVARYGEFVLLKPPLGGHTLVLWLGPVAIVAAAAAGIVLARRRAVAPADPASLTPEEEARLRTVLERAPERS